MASLTCPCARVVWRDDLLQSIGKVKLESSSCKGTLSKIPGIKLYKPLCSESGSSLQRRRSFGRFHAPIPCALLSITSQAEVADSGVDTELLEERQVEHKVDPPSGKADVVRSSSSSDGAEQDGPDSVSPKKAGGTGRKPRAKRGPKKKYSAKGIATLPAQQAEKASTSPVGGGQLSASELRGADMTIVSTSSEVGAGDAWPRSEPSDATQHVPEASAGGQVDGGEEVPSTSSDSDDPEVEKGYRMSKVCDRLVEVFMVGTPDPLEWRKLLIFSEEWSKIRPYFYKRCKELADKEENYTRKAELLKLGRKLKEVEDDMARHDELMTLIEKDPSELETIISRRRKDFTSDFFTHLKTHAEASHKNLNRRDEIATLAARCLSLIEIHDATLEDQVSVTAAQEKFDSILASPSLEAATEKINELARNKQLDPTLMLLMTKAWAAAKESNIVKEEAKDIMYHLYTVARGNMQRLVPKEVRILRHILSMEDPRERMHALGDAFAPGEEVEGDQVDMLYTTPPDLYKWIKAVLDAYYSNREGTLIKEAAQLMNPMVIHRLEALKLQVEDQYL